MIINKLLKVWCNGFWECPFTEVKIHVSETLGTNESVRCLELRGGCFPEVAHVQCIISIGF